MLSIEQFENTRNLLEPFASFDNEISKDHNIDSKKNHSFLRSDIYYDIFFFCTKIASQKSYDEKTFPLFSVTRMLNEGYDSNTFQHSYDKYSLCLDGNMFVYVKNVYKDLRFLKLLHETNKLYAAKFFKLLVILGSEIGKQQKLSSWYYDFCAKSTYYANEFITDISDKNKNVTDIIGQKEYELIKNVCDSVISFSDSLEKSKDIQNKLESFIGTKIESITFILILKDIEICFYKLGHPYCIKGKEGAILIYLICHYTKKSKPSLSELKNVSSTKMLTTTFEALLLNISQSINISGGFVLPKILRSIDAELEKHYLLLLNRVANIIAKIDGNIDNTEKEWLASLLKIVDDGSIELCKNRDVSEVIDTTETLLRNNSETSEITIATPLTAIDELKGLIGLSNVKKEVFSLYNFIKMKQIRESKGLKAPSLSYHCVFTGNSGTGKTTVARILANIFKELGIISKGHLVETDRSGLVAEYVGQTAVKTNKIIDSALDGVLFIDEAYSLVQDYANDFGKEAIATLLKRMEDERDRLIVILAGYHDEMQDCININPGLRSRFNRYIFFPDYSAAELLEIFKLHVKNYEYTISEEINNFLLDKLTEITERQEKDFGNGRYIRNLFEKTIENQANRLSYMDNITMENLKELSLVDIKNSFEEIE